VGEECGEECVRGRGVRERMEGEDRRGDNMEEENIRDKEINIPSANNHITTKSSLKRSAVEHLILNAKLSLLKSTLQKTQF
jgi:hypothetical protein